MTGSRLGLVPLLCALLDSLPDAAGSCWETDHHSAARARPPPGGRDWLCGPAIHSGRTLRPCGSPGHMFRRTAAEGVESLPLGTPHYGVAYSIHTHKYEHPRVCISWRLPASTMPQTWLISGNYFVLSLVNLCDRALQTFSAKGQTGNVSGFVCVLQLLSCAFVVKSPRCQVSEGAGYVMRKPLMYLEII